MTKFSVQSLVENYRNLFAAHSDGAAVAQCSAEGQFARFAQLAKIDDLSGKGIIDLGCNLGGFFQYLSEVYSGVDYCGIDIVPEIIERASILHPSANFICRDVLQAGFGVEADYVLMSMLFNNKMSSADLFMQNILCNAFAACRKGVGFNFISTHVNFKDAELQYYDPLVVYDYCMRSLSSKVVMNHHYFRCDVSVFVYK